MINEILLILSVPVIFGSLLAAFRLFGRSGLYMMTVVCTVSANIEVMILVNAFGVEQTLGNVLFAATFLITDILSECYGKKAADKAVNIGIFTSVFFLIISQSWMLFIPSANDFVHPYITAVFSNTPRMMLSSLLVYAVCQKLDVFLYHKWWALTEKLSGNKRAHLWIRNNGSTLLSQLINTVLFNLAAFWGIYDTSTLISIILSGYVIYIITSLLDTPFVYAARRIYERNKEKLA
ncbi:MAG: queuosine precursor transporter [Clostridia bacterium]|nr:queuosine precursor transporter [Clostridia bacterium]